MFEKVGIEKTQALFMHVPSGKLGRIEVSGEIDLERGLNVAHVLTRWLDD